MFNRHAHVGCACTTRRTQLSFVLNTHTHTHSTLVWFQSRAFLHRGPVSPMSGLELRSLFLPIASDGLMDDDYSRKKKNTFYESFHLKKNIEKEF